MSRLFARDDWRLALMGVLAGIATLLFVLLLFFALHGAGSKVMAPPAALRKDTTSANKAGRDTDPDAGPVIGRFQAGVSKMLRDTRPETTPMRGPLHLTIRDIEWRERDGRTFARAAGATALLATGPMVDTDAILSDVVLNDPEIFLRESRPEVWNFQAVFYELLHAPETGEPKRRIHLNDFRIANGYVDVKRPLDAFSFRNVEGQIASLTLSDPALAEPLMLLSTADAIFERPSSRTRLPIHAEDAKMRFPLGTVVFDVARANIENTRVANVTGVWDPERGGYGVTAEGDATAFNIADFRSFAPERFPDDGTATFHFYVEPLPGDGTHVALTDMKAEATGAAATGALAFQFYPTSFQLGDVDLRVQYLALSLVERVMGRTLPYGGSIAGTIRGPGSAIGLDLIASLTTPTIESPFATHVTGTISMLSSGLDIKQLNADVSEVPVAILRAFAPSLPLSGLMTGTLSIKGEPRRTPVTLDARLELGTGLATMSGMLDLTGALPRYDMTGRLVGIDLHTIIKPAVPPVTVGARFAISGTGFKPEEIDARMRVDGSFHGWQSAPGDTLLASIRIRNGTAEVDTLISSLATASLDARGSWHFIEPLSGAVHYRAEITSLTPFGPYLPVIGDSIAAGSLEASGDISGSLEHMLLAGRVQAEEARSGGWSASNLDATYAVVLGGTLPEVQLDATGRGISTPTAGTYGVATAHVRMQPPGFNLEFSAQRAGAEGAVELSATGVMPDSGARELSVQRAYFDLTEGRWQMTKPARVSWGGEDGVRIDSLMFRNESTTGEFLIDGRVLPRERADFTARVAALPIGDIQELMGRTPMVTGQLWADARVRPPGESPDIGLSFRLENGAIQGIPVAHMQGTLDYADERALARLTASLDTAGSIDIDAAIPMSIRLTGDTLFKMLDAGNLSGHVTTQNFSLAPADSFLTMVRGVRGLLNGTVAIGGTIGDPQLTGDLALTGGSVNVPQLNQTYQDLSGTLHFAGRVAQLQNVSARSDGLAELTGDITFEKVNEPVLALTATFNGFRPLGVDNQPDAAVDGTVKIDGKLDELVVTGGVAIRDGYVLIPQFGADIGSSYGDLGMASPVLGEDLATSFITTWMQNLAVRDFDVTFGDGVWIAAQEARVQLAGSLTVNKSGDDVRMIGELEGQRGTYALSAGPVVRRFDITHATVRFLGGTEMNPSLDIDARRIVLNADARRMNVDVHIGGTVRSPTLQLSSLDAPNIPQEELLSFLLFGQQTLSVGANPLGSQGLRGELVGTFVGGVYEFLSLKLEQAVVSGLGIPLDVFQVSYGQQAGTTVVVGRQLADKVFLSLESTIAALGGEPGAATAAQNTWALRVEWALAPQSSLQFGFEPVRPAARIRGLGSLLTGSRQQQGFVELRRRWTW